MSTPGEAPLTTVGDEVAGVLAAVDSSAVSKAAAFLTEEAGDPHGWFFTGQGRSGLVAQMAAMRFMHLGLRTHVWGEVTAPSVERGDRLVVLSKSGSTATSLLLVKQAIAHGARVLAVTGDPHSELAEQADESVVIPSAVTVQFGGSLFEQVALLFFDALALRLSGQDQAVYAQMARRHSNLQ